MHTEEVLHQLLVLYADYSVYVVASEHDIVYMAGMYASKGQHDKCKLSL